MHIAVCYSVERKKAARLASLLASLRGLGCPACMVIALSHQLGCMLIGGRWSEYGAWCMPGVGGRGWDVLHACGGEGW